MGTKHLSPAALALAALSLGGCAVHVTDPSPASTASPTSPSRASAVPRGWSSTASVTSSTPAPDPGATDLPLAQVETKPGQGVPATSPVWGRMSQVVAYPVAQMPPGNYQLQGDMSQAVRCRARAYADAAMTDSVYASGTNGPFSVPDEAALVVLDHCEARTSSRKVMAKAPKEPEPTSVSTGPAAP